MFIPLNVIDILLVTQLRWKSVFMVSMFKHFKTKKIKMFRSKSFIGKKKNKKTTLLIPQRVWPHFYRLSRYFHNIRSYFVIFFDFDLFVLISFWLKKSSLPTFENYNEEGYIVSRFTENPIWRLTARMIKMNIKCASNSSIILACWLKCYRKTGPILEQKLQRTSILTRDSFTVSC